MHSTCSEMLVPRVFLDFMPARQQLAARNLQIVKSHGGVSSYSNRTATQLDCLIWKVFRCTSINFLACLVDVDMSDSEKSDNQRRLLEH